MSKFNQGDTAYFKGSKGTIDYVEDGYIVIVLDNGSEMDFTDESKLFTVDEHDQKNQDAADQRSEQMAERSKADGVNTGMYAYIERKGDQKDATCAVALIEKIYAPLALIVKDEPTDLDKVKALSEKTGTPVTVLLAFHDDEEMMRQVLQKTMLTAAMDQMTGNGTVVEEVLLAKVKAALGK